MTKLDYKAILLEIDSINLPYTKLTEEKAPIDILFKKEFYVILVGLFLLQQMFTGLFGN